MNMKMRVNAGPTNVAWMVGLTLWMGLSLAPSARAIEFSVISAPTVTVNPGQAFTLDIAVDNALGDVTQAMTARITGLSSAGAVVLSGQTAVSHFVGVCLATFCVDGLDTVDNLQFNPNDLAASAQYTPGDDSIQIIAAAALSATAHSGAIDPGLDGPLDMPSARDVTLELVANALGTHVLVIGGTFVDANTNLEVPIPSEAFLTINIVPEPSAALLVGLGLAGLSARRGRERR